MTGDNKLLLRSDSTIWMRLRANAHLSQIILILKRKLLGVGASRVTGKENGSNAFVYANASDEALSFSIILTRSGTDCAFIFSIARLR